MNTTPFLMSAYAVRMPKILYGTAWKKERTAALVEQALRLGFRGIDTACQPKHYNEAGVGAGIAAASLALGLDRTELYLQSKFTDVSGQDPDRIPYDPNASLGDQVAQSFQASLSNLQTTYLDCLVLHSPLTTPQDTLLVWQAMEHLVHSGGVKQLGISNCYDLAAFEMLVHHADIKPAVLQNRFYANTQYDQTLRSFCRQHKIYYQSFWTLTANSTVLEDARLQSLATTYARSAAQVFFRYLSQRDIIPLTGTTAVQHMQEDLAIFDFELTPDDCALLDTLL